MNDRRDVVSMRSKADASAWLARRWAIVKTLTWAWSSLGTMADLARMVPLTVWMVGYVWFVPLGKRGRRKKSK